MNGGELARALAQAQGIPAYKARQAVRIVTDQIVGTLRAGGSVSLSGLGKMKVKQMAARDYTNPKDKTKVVKAAARYGVAFTAAPGLFNNPVGVVENKPTV